MTFNIQASLGLFSLCREVPEYRSANCKHYPHLLNPLDCRWCIHATKASTNSVCQQNDYKQRMVKLLSEGADPNFRHERSSCLCEAIRRGNHIAADIVLDNGASVDMGDFIFERTPLCLAAYCGQLEIVQSLIHHGADIRFENLSHILGLRSMYSPTDEHISRCLIEHGAQVNLIHLGDPLISSLFSIGASVDYIKAIADAGASPYYSGTIRLGHYRHNYKPIICHLAAVGFKILLEKIYSRQIGREANAPCECNNGGPCEDLLHIPAPIREDKYLFDLQTKAPSLEFLCRIRIRHEVAFSKRSCHIREKIDQLPVPSQMKAYLKLDHLISPGQYNLTQIHAHILDHWVDDTVPNFVKFLKS